MKFLVLATCLSVSAAQGFFGLVGHPNGAVVPIDEPRVAAARADHLATKFGSLAGPVGFSAGPAGYAAGYAAGPVGYAAGPIGYAAGPVGYAAVPYAAGYGYSGPLNLNTHLVAHPNGAVVPADEPAVVAARADHFAAQGASYAAAGPIAQVGYGVAGSAYNSYSAGPLDFAGPAYNGYAAGYGYSGPLNLNTHLVAHPNGAVVPADEPAVVAARADHFAAQGASYAAAGPGAVYAQAVPAVYGAGYGLAPYAGLVAHPNGAVVPVDEPAVQAARASHLSLLGASY